MNPLKFLLFQVLIVISLPYGFGQEKVAVGTETGEFRNFNINFRVIDALTGESIQDANILIEPKGEIGVTNDNGSYSTTLYRSEYKIQVSNIGYKSLNLQIIAIGDGRLLIQLERDEILLDEVVVLGTNPEDNFRSTELGTQRMGISTIEALPPLMGEVDVLRSIALLPGVSTVGEVSGGFNVRGGSSDQNLVLLGGAPVYNPAHLFGFFTSFNSDIVTGVTLHKGGVAARFGGRASSIMDVKYKSGNLDYWNTKISLGTVSSKATIDGPIIKNKLSLLVSGRASHLNWLLGTIKDPELRNSSAVFNDANVVLNAELSEDSNLSYKFYTSTDQFAIASDTVIGWQNQNHVLNWNQRFSEKFNVNVTAYSSLYDFNIQSGIRDHGGKLDMNFSLSETNHINFGGEGKYISINPGTLTPGTQESPILPFSVAEEQGIELAAYIQHNVELTDKIAISYGLRYDRFSNLGPGIVNVFRENFPRTEPNIVEQVEFDKNEVIQTYDGWSPRVSLRYTLNPTSSIKAGYNKMYQFIHLISNTTTIAPTDTWKLSDPFLAPQIADQYSIGYFKNFKRNVFETSIEAFYKDINNVVEYKDGADLILNDNLETELLNGKGLAYGVELYLKKNIGRLTGWASYTYSRSLRQVISPFDEELINNGEWFPSNFDKPHDLTLVTNYKINTYVTLSANFSYSTGRPVTLPVAKFAHSNTQMAYFDNRNQDRIPDFHRLDVSLKFGFRSNKKVFQGDWVFSVFNIYGRENPFSVFFRDVRGAPPQAYQLAILGVPLPSLSYSFKL